MSGVRIVAAERGAADDNQSDHQQQSKANHPLFPKGPAGLVGLIRRSGVARARHATSGSPGGGLNGQLTLHRMANRGKTTERQPEHG